ncbi:PREDICTED: uncharacterized protein LOC109331069 [Lupinus angustifolius]|uniref:uncharacterized protein LOC109331069 n=1 Tax=Lupinus angustifolius TaxID=3871 RepID=UPI00092F6FEB|nr:PREDICTED: uncharacterized protein LOC109331069 [Lupinus angustifolius]
MLHQIIKNFRVYKPCTSFPHYLSSNLAKGSTSVLRFCTRNDTAHNSNGKSTIEEGYGATRSDEKGFEGGDGVNKASSKIDMDKFIHEDHPAYDKTQTKRSEVKEKGKGKARH